MITSSERFWQVFIYDKLFLEQNSIKNWFKVASENYIKRVVSRNGEHELLGNLKKGKLHYFILICFNFIS